MKELTVKERIAKRVADFFTSGDLVSLGVGVPALVPAFLPEGANIWMLADNGMIGGIPLEEGEEVDVFERIQEIITTDFCPEAVI